MKGSQNLKSQDSYQILKQNTNVSFKTNNKLFTVLKQHVIGCVQSAFLWRRHMHKDKLALINRLINDALVDA